MNEISTHYSLAFWAILLIILTCLVQWVVASLVKAAQPGAVPGKMDGHLGHESFVFRAHRTFMNSLENVPLFLATAFVAILLLADPLWTGIFIWLFAVARLLHMVLYYALATARNPSPRSYFFVLGALAHLALLGLCVVTLL